MPTRKTDDLVVVAREYKNSQGELKKQWLNVGRVFVFDDGSEALIIDRHINLAGLPGEGGVRVYRFEPREQNGQGGGAPQRPNQAAARPKPAPKAQPDYDDDIPF